MNILIVGLGSIARKHIEAIQFLNFNATIYALRSTNNVVNEEGIINVFSLDYLDIKFDFAIISNPTHLHFEYIQLLAKKNIPLFIEKPAVHSLDKSAELISFIESKKRS
jgi:predicted dehydrogenase